MGKYWPEHEVIVHADSCTLYQLSYMANTGRMGDISKQILVSSISKDFFFLYM